MKKLLSFVVNGQKYETLVDTRQTLLDVLRDNLFLTGTKEGCSNGNCGSCTVLMDGRTVNSCLVFALEAQGRGIVTIEGVAKNGVLHPVQRAFIEHGAIQCGFCTPGLIISAIYLLEHNPNPTEYEIRKAIAGNLCRCTGYDKIVRAIAVAAQEMKAR